MQNLFHVDVDLILMVGNVTRDKNGTITSVSVSVKINNNACKEDYVWNPSTWSCECEIVEYLKDCEFMKSLADDLVVSCDEIVDTPETALINSSGGINHGLIAVVLLATACLLLLMVMVVKYYMKPRLTISCLFLY